MPKVVYDKLNHHALAPTAMCLQLVDQSVPNPVGIVENIMVQKHNFIIPIDFIVLDMEVDSKTPLILGRPFLTTVNAHIDVGAREIQLNINGQKETFAFKSKNNALKSKQSTGRRNLRKIRRSHPSHLSKPSLST